MGVGRRGLLYLRRAIPSFRFKMDLRSKLLVDRLVFCPIAHFLNTLTMLTCWLVRRDHSPLQGDAEGRTIVICKFAGMGSIVNATGVIRVLRQYHAGAQIVFFTSRANRPLMQLIPDIDRCLYLDDRNPWRLAVSIAAPRRAVADAGRYVLSIWRSTPPFRRSSVRCCCAQPAGTVQPVRFLPKVPVYAHARVQLGTQHARDLLESCRPGVGDRLGASPAG